MTCGSASQAMEEARLIKEDITVELETNTILKVKVLLERKLIIWKQSSGIS